MTIECYLVIFTTMDFGGSLHVNRQEGGPSDIMLKCMLDELAI